MSFTFGGGRIGKDQDGEKTKEVAQDVEHRLRGERTVEDVAEDRGNPGIVETSLVAAVDRRITQILREHELAVAQELNE